VNIPVTLNYAYASFTIIVGLLEGVFIFTQYF